jgi:hypothetical protein
MWTIELDFVGNTQGLLPEKIQQISIGSGHVKFPACARACLEA